MTREEFKALCNKKVVLLDGATGTELQQKGMPVGVCPEKWVAEHPEALMEIQSQYQDAGSDIVYTCTFGGNRQKLSEFGLDDEVYELNCQLARISRQAVGGKALVAGDIGSTGLLVEPFGPLSFEEAVAIYKEQIAGLLQGGVDLFVIETMMDIQEARAALIAVKESCDLPVMVTMTFDEDGRTLTGTDPVTALITLQSLGADAVGCNCSTGPELMADFIATMKPYAKVPLIAKPNAGLPRLVDGRTVFDMSSEEFGGFAARLIEAGADLIGGCCGTAPGYIKEMSLHTAGIGRKQHNPLSFSAVTSARKTVFVGADLPVTVVGERINPTGKKSLQAELAEGKLGEVRRLALAQIEAGASVLDVNVGMGGIDERAMMVKAISVLSAQVEAPLCIDSASPEVIEAALRIYPGRALINSISAETVKMKKLLPIAAKYGAMFILLPLGDEGIPNTAEERTPLIERVVAEAENFGFTHQDIVIDGLVMTVSAEQRAAMETLQVVEWASHHGFNSILGLSNVSFGLPERGWVNGAFLAMAVAKGLTLAIANPSLDILINMKLAADVLTGRDQNSNFYIRHFSSKKNLSEGQQETNHLEMGITHQIHRAVVTGQTESVTDLIGRALLEGYVPQAIMNEQLIPAINYVGELFEQKQYFLPQLIQSAETMKAAFEYLQPYLQKEASANVDAPGIVLATVKGDIHDIGKNIVGLMLRNYGFTVYDLGKDVDAEVIVKTAIETGAELIGLSALMTTTMIEMKKVIELARAKGLKCKFLIGGAAVDQAFADAIGADAYAADAHYAVKLAKQLSGTKILS